MYKAHDHRQMNEKYMIAKRILLSDATENYTPFSLSRYLFTVCMHVYYLGKAKLNNMRIKMTRMCQI